jgi:bilirubin oxidase
MRFIGGTDSRTWILQLSDRSTGTVIPFWQIGTEQGLLNNPVQRTSMVLMPGERLDVLVDFKAVAPGSRIVMKNLGPDVPYNGLTVL